MRKRDKDKEVELIDQTKLTSNDSSSSVTGLAFSDCDGLTASLVQKTCSFSSALKGFRTALLNLCSDESKGVISSKNEGE